MRRHFAPALIALMLCLPFAMQAKVEHLLPKVHSLTETQGTPFALQRAVTISYPTEADSCKALEQVFADYGCAIDQSGAIVTVQMVENIEGAYDYTLEGYDNEGYQLIVTENAITIKAVKPIGVIRAAQTLAQLAEGYDTGAAAIETVEITDWAAFKLRGYMHDVGRSFISVDELKKHIDLLSRFKVNTFHWHFTENQAWRFEVIDNDPTAAPDYTMLTSAESMTRFPGEYYTQAQCREVAAYAKEHGIIIIPEIDMPGHSDAFERAMGYSMQTDEGVAVLKEVLTQLVDVFPDAPYIHIGADEEAITYTKDGKGFLEIIASHVRETLQRKLVVWNPIQGVSINSTMCDMTQMWSSRGANINGVPDIDCRYNYTNHFDVFADVVGIYKSNIYYKAQGDAEIAGTISAYWNDRKTPTEVDIVKQNNLYANVLASAERAWYGGRTDGEAGYIEKLGTTLPNSGEVYEEFKDWETRFLFHKTHSLKDEPIPYVKQTNVRWRITDPFPNGGNSAATFAPDQYATSTDDEGLIPETFTHEGKTYYTGMATGAGIYLRHTWGNNTIPTYYGGTNYSNSTAYAWTYVCSPKAQTVGAQIEFQNYGRSEHDKTPYVDKWDRKGSDIWINGTRVNPPAWVNPNTDPTNEDDLQNENFTARTPIAVQLNEGWNKVFIKLPYVGADGVRLNKWMFTFVLTDLEGKNAVDGLIYSPNQCKDEATEAVAAKISELKRDRGALIGTAVGLWPESAAATLDAKIAEVEATYSEEKTAEDRAAQVTVLEEAWTTFIASLADANMNQPVSGNYYRMYTPLRDSRYPTGKGAGNAIIGEQNPTSQASIWQFVKRTDGAYDIINLADGTYMSPASSYNTAINAVAEQPTAGWTLKRANTNGYVIVTSTKNNAQLNQTGSDQSYKLYNWGYNSTGFSNAYNTTDTGCQYLVEEVTVTLPAKVIASICDLDGESFPYAVGDAEAAKIFAHDDISIAIDVTVPASMSGRQALVCAADPTQSVTGPTKTNSPYIAYGLNGSNPAYLPSSADGDKFTYRDFAAVANTNYKVVYVVDKTNQKFSIYVDGVLKGTAQYPVVEYELQSFSNFAANDNAKLYLGAGVVDNTTPRDLFRGTIHSVHFLEGAVTAEQVALIQYSEEQEEDDVIDTDPLESVAITDIEEFENGGVYTFVTKRGWMGATQSGNKVISTAKTQVTPAAAANNRNFQWLVYKSTKGNYYLYNMGKKKFMGVQSANNTEISFVDKPAGKKLTFKRSSSNEYPIMFSTDNAGVVNHSTVHGGGLITWTGGWNNLNDDGSNHKVTRIKRLDTDELKSIADLIEGYDVCFYATAEVEGLAETNPNTHYGSIRATNGTNVMTTNLKRGDGVVAVDYDGTMTTTIDFARAYRGFEFSGFYVGEQSLGKSLELTDALKALITEKAPLVAKFAPTEDVTLFYDDDEFSYRIPAIATTSTGRLIAVSDYRHSLDDIGRDNHGTGTLRIDLVARTSDDNGKTWSEAKTIAEGSGNKNADGYDCAYGDAAIATVGQNVLVMAAAGNVCYPYASASSHNRTVRLFSADNGATWTKEDISEKLFIGENALIPNGHAAFFGSGKLAVDEDYNGTGKARIYGAMLLKNATTTTNIYVIYTDDLGLTWSILGGSTDPVANNDEPKIEILPSGQILLSVRRGGGRQFNVFTYTDKATSTGTWDSNVNGCGNGGSNTCNGEIFLVDAKNEEGVAVKLLLQSQPKGGGGLYDRRDVTIWYKEVDNTNYTSEQIAADWTEGLQVSTQLSAYSTMSLQKDGRIAFFFEEAPCYGDDYTKGYCMVYVPLTLSDITDGAYKGLEPTGIENSQLTTHNSQLIYDLMGRKVETVTEHGIYIVGGKKVVK